MKIRLTLNAATSLAMPVLTSTLAHAQPVTGPYVGAGVGYNIELKQNLRNGVVGATALPGNASVATQDGFMGQITAQGFGDTDLLVPTGPGVRETQNRRVQIVLQ